MALPRLAWMNIEMDAHAKNKLLLATVNNQQDKIPFEGWMCLIGTANNQTPHYSIALLPEWKNYPQPLGYKDKVLPTSGRNHRLGLSWGSYEWHAIGKMTMGFQTSSTIFIRWEEHAMLGPMEPGKMSSMSLPYGRQGTYFQMSSRISNQTMIPGTWRTHWKP